MENNSLALWQIYQTARFSQFWLDLRSNRVLVVLSVWNAHGKTCSAMQNRKLAAFVAALLRKRGVQFQTLWGGSENMCYRELTFAFYVSNTNDAYAFARLAKQKAFYIVKNRKLTLCATNKRYFPKTLGNVKEYLVAVPKRQLIYASNQAIAE